MKSRANKPSIATNFNQATILVVEPQDHDWALLDWALQRGLSEVIARRVVTPQQALSQLNEWYGEHWQLPKLILCELELGQASDGFELVKAIKQLDNPINHVPLVMLCPSQARSFIKQAYQLGVSCCLLKPGDQEGWQKLVDHLRAYRWETVTMPRSRFSY